MQKYLVDSLSQIKFDLLESPKMWAKRLSPSSDEFKLWRGVLEDSVYIPNARLVPTLVLKPNSLYEIYDWELQVLWRIRTTNETFDTF